MPFKVSERYQALKGILQVVWDPPCHSNGSPHAHSGVDLVQSLTSCSRTPCRYNGRVNAVQIRFSFVDWRSGSRQSSLPIGAPAEPLLEIGAVGAHPFTALRQRLAQSSAELHRTIQCMWRCPSSCQTADGPNAKSRQRCTLPCMLYLPAKAVQASQHNSGHRSSTVSRRTAHDFRE